MKFCRSIALLLVAAVLLAAGGCEKEESPSFEPLEADTDKYQVCLLPTENAYYLGGFKFSGIILDIDYYNAEYIPGSNCIIKLGDGRIMPPDDILYREAGGGDHWNIYADGTRVFIDYTKVAAELQGKSPSAEVDERVVSYDEHEMTFQDGTTIKDPFTPFLEIRSEEGHTMAEYLDIIMTDDQYSHLRDHLTDRAQKYVEKFKNDSSTVVSRAPESSLSSANESGSESSSSEGSRPSSSEAAGSAIVSSMPEASTAGLESEVSYTPEEKQELIEYGQYLLACDPSTDDPASTYTEREKQAVIAYGEYLLTCENGEFPTCVRFDTIDVILRAIDPELCDKVFDHFEEVARPAARF